MVFYYKQDKLKKQMLNQQRSKVQRKVYLRQMSHNCQQYLQQILLQCSSPNKYLRYGLAQMSDNVQNSVLNDIMLTDKYEVRKKTAMTKQQLVLLQKSLTYIKNNEGSIRDKVGDLKLQIRSEAQRLNDRSLQIVSKQSYAANHPKTKQVQIFLKNIQNEKRQQRKKYQESLERQQIKKKRIEQLKQIQREKALSQRHQRLVQAYEIKRRIKKQEKDMSEKKQREFKQHFKVFKNSIPLFKKKQQQFYQKFVVEQNKHRYNKLLKKQQEYVPISQEQFQDHEQRYMDQKKQYLAKHKTEVKMKKQMQKRWKKEVQNFHKGQFRYFVLQQMVQKKQAKDPKQQILQKKLRQLAYSQNVKEQYKPKIDPLKRFELQSLIKSSNRKKRYRNPQKIQSSSVMDTNSYYSPYDSQKQLQKDPKKQGERNRRYFKQYIRDKIQRGQVKNKSDAQRPATLQPRTNYLHQLRSQRQSTVSVKKYGTIDDQIRSIKQKQDVAALLSKVQYNDRKAERLEKKFRHAAHKPEEQASLQDNYLFSIKAKLQLLKNYD